VCVCVCVYVYTCVCSCVRVCVCVHLSEPEAWLPVNERDPRLCTGSVEEIQNMTQISSQIDAK
jgi:hypothetical protein